MNFETGEVKIKESNPLEVTGEAVRVGFSGKMERGRHLEEEREKTGIES